MVDTEDGDQRHPWDGRGATGGSLNRPWMRSGARLLGPGLDRRLALGQPPERSWLLAARAVRLVAPAFRSRLASAWQRLVDTARSEGPVTGGAVRIRRTVIQRLEPEVRAVIEGLRAPGPVPARGVAMANTLISDGAGPLYRGQGTDALWAALRSTAEHLDSAAPLV